MKIRDTFTKYTERPHGALGLIADLFGLIGFGIACWNLIDDVPQGILAVALALLTFACVAYALSTVGETGRLRAEASGANEQASKIQLRWTGLDKLHEAAATLTHASVLTRREGDSIQERFIEDLDHMCSSMSAAMKDITGHPCRVTLQETYLDEQADGSREAVRRLASSSYTMHSGDGDSDVDWVADNTDFDTIYGGATHYVCNDLVAALKTGYKNSHWTSALLTLWATNDDYPYRSALVLPVAGPTDGPSTAHQLIGFLSIDSKQVDVFDEATVSVVGRIATTSTYASLIHYRAWRKDNE